MSVVVFTGSRTFTDEVAVLVALRAVAKYGATVHVGDAAGLDRMTRDACDRIGIPCVVHVADWKTEGKAAGFLRNLRMIETRPDRVVAFFGPGPETRGTRHTVDAAIRARIPVVIFREGSKRWETVWPPTVVPA